MKYEPTQVVACTYQAISGAGKTFESWPEMVENVIPYIGGEEAKSEQEPLRIWGHIEDGVIVKAQAPVITSQCIRVPVVHRTYGGCFVNFKQKVEKKQLIEDLRTAVCLRKWICRVLRSSSSVLEDDDRPQVKLDVNYENGMGVSFGRLREDLIFDWKFVGLSHNTLRGAAGGALLCAESLVALGYIEAK